MAYLSTLSGVSAKDLPPEVWAQMSMDLSAKWQAFRVKFATWIEQQRKFESADIVRGHENALARWDGSSRKVLGGDLTKLDSWLKSMEGTIKMIDLPTATYTTWDALRETLATLPDAVAEAAGKAAGDLIKSAAKGLGLGGIVGVLAVVGIAYVGIPVLIAKLGR